MMTLLVTFIGSYTVIAIVAEKNYNLNYEEYRDVSLIITSLIPALVTIFFPFKKYEENGLLTGMHNTSLKIFGFLLFSTSGTIVRSAEHSLKLEATVIFSPFLIALVSYYILRRLLSRKVESSEF